MAKLVQKKQYVPTQEFNQKSHYRDYVELNKEYFGEHPSTLAEQYQKEPKKPKKLAKWIVNLMVICSVIIGVVVMSVLCSVFIGGGSGDDYTDKGKTNVHGFVGLEVMPESETINTSSYKDDKDLAAYLYKTAALNAKDTEALTAHNTGLLFMEMGSSKNYIDIDSVVMKSQQEYFSMIYHIKNSVPILDTFIGDAIAKTTDVVTAERTYAKKGSSYMGYQKVKNNQVDEYGIPSANWESVINVPSATIKKAVPVFNSSQSGIFEIVKHKITAETISTVEVTHNKKEGYYSVKLTLDPTNPSTTVDSLADIQAGTGDQNAQYTLLSSEFTVWDTGYFRSFYMQEKWSAKVLISLNFELTSDWLFSYAKEDCNFKTYPDAVSAAKALG